MNVPIKVGGRSRLRSRLMDHTLTDHTHTLIMGKLMSRLGVGVG